MTPQDIRVARTALGGLWGLGRHLTLNELARALRLRGKAPDDTVAGWERGSPTPSGPVTVAIEMMLEPPDAVIEDAIRVAGGVAVVEGTTLHDLLAERVGEAAVPGILEDLVLGLSDLLRRPPTVEEAVGPTQLHNRDRRRTARFHGTRGEGGD